ncbi:site-2 protease family protein [Nakamurella sp.]|uniref:site-2 protease family protein n=1 Tax=Nakamurella sp. TaxID=1869182 RepID=UPI003B39FAEF
MPGPVGGSVGGSVLWSGPGPGLRFAAVRGWTVGRIAGVRIVITPSWIASVAVVAVLGVPVIGRVVPGTGPAVAVPVAIGLGVLLGVSVLAHELGHCVVARWLGIEVVAVRLYLLGGASELATGPAGARDEALVAAAGPAVSGLLAGACWLVLQPVPDHTLTWLVLLLLALSNLVIAAFNLLPALPLDGGRVIRAGVWGLTGSRRAGTIAAVVGGLLLVGALLGWAVLLVVADGAAALLPAGIAVVMALFVGAGLVAERSDGDGPERTGSGAGATGPAGWPPGTELPSLARPVVRLAADAPVHTALAAAAHGVVVLAEADGVARGNLDAGLARDQAGRDPLALAALAARPITPEAIVFAGDDPADVLARARRPGPEIFVLVDDTGLPTGAIRATDILAVPHRQGRNPTA